MKEEKILKFFIENGFSMENGLYIGSRNYAFLPFNKSLIVGKYSAKGLLVEGIFKDTSIRKIWFDKKRGVMIDVKEDPSLKDLSKIFKGAVNDPLKGEENNSEDTDNA